jgi:hypothetical protein
MWGTRNQIVHGATAYDQAAVILQHLHEKVWQYYNQFQQDTSFLLPRHHHLFTRQTLDQRLSHSHNHLNSWLRSVEEARQVLAHQIHQEQAISRFFGSSGHHLDDASDDSIYQPNLGSPSITSTTYTATTLPTSDSSDAGDSTASLTSTSCSTFLDLISKFLRRARAN